MKKMGLNVLAILILSLNLQACSRISSNANTCGKSGMFGDQAECQASGNTCNQSVVQGDSGNVMCWSQSTTSNQTTTNTGSGGLDPCSPSPWVLGQWSTCSPSTPTATRTVTCNSSCNCTGSVMPATSQACVADLHTGAHYSTQCTDGVEIIDGKKVCGFNQSSCPAGWQSLKGSGGIAYTITQKAGGYNKVSCTYNPQVMSYTGEHLVMQATAVETKSICSERNCGLFTDSCKTNTTLVATVKRVACY